MQDFRVSVAEILGHPGEYRDVVLRRPLEGIQTPLARLDARGIDGELRVESVVEGVLVTGRVRGDALLQCARCLAEFRSEVAPRVCDLFAGPAHEATDDDDVYQIEGMEIDLEPMARDAIALALPLNPLCREDCKGLCSTCGTDLNRGTCDCKEEDFDPRWAALSELRQRLES